MQIHAHGSGEWEAQFLCGFPAHQTIHSQNEHETRTDPRRKDHIGRWRLFDRDSDERPDQDE